MNVLLVKPYNLSDHIQPPLGLGYLANAIRGKTNVRLVDCIKDRVTTPARLTDIVKKFKPDVVGIQCYTFDLKFINEAFEKIKKISKDTICVVGGPHPSTAPKETMEWFFPYADYGFIGEAEIGFSKLVDAISTQGYNMESIPGLIWREGAEIRINEARIVEDLDSLGYPAWDLIRPQTYPECQHGAFYRKFPIAPIIVTRGCPYSCGFCAASKISGKKIRKHSIDYIIREIKMLYDDFKIREFHIIDDNFTYNLDYAKDLLRSIIDLGLNISWATPNGVRLDKLDEEMLDLMKRSGLYLISAGIESGSDRILKLMRKGTTVSQIRGNIRMIRRAGIEIAGFFIIGYPGETKEDIEETIRFACDLDILRANFFTYLPFPGTESFNQLKANGELDNVDWDNFYFMSAAYVPQTLTRRQLKKYLRKAFFRFFLRPRIFIKNITQIKSLRHLKFIMIRFYHWIICG